MMNRTVALGQDLKEMVAAMDRELTRLKNLSDSMVLVVRMLRLMAGYPVGADEDEVASTRY